MNFDPPLKTLPGNVRGGLHKLKRVLKRCEDSIVPSLQTRPVDQYCFNIVTQGSSVCYCCFATVCRSIFASTRLYASTWNHEHLKGRRATVTHSGNTRGSVLCKGSKKQKIEYSNEKCVILKNLAFYPVNLHDGSAGAVNISANNRFPTERS